MPSGYEKSTTLREEILATLDDKSSSKGDPTALKQQQSFETIIKKEDSFSDIYFIG